MKKETMEEIKNYFSLSFLTVVGCIVSVMFFTVLLIFILVAIGFY